jgi:hypothetical protein
MASRNVRQARERPEREHERLIAVSHRRIAVTARDLLALDGAVHGSSNRRDKIPTRPGG